MVDRLTPTSWDLEADVVIVGLGAAGVCAALASAQCGARTLVLEGGGAGGGTSAMSGGLLYLGGGTPIQTGCGYVDSPEEMHNFLMAACGPGTDGTKVRRYCEGSVEHYHWLVDHGVPFKAEFYDEPGIEPPTDAGLVFSGGEDTHPFNTIATPAPRAHKPQFPGAAGGFLMQRLLAALETTSVTVEYDIKAHRLTTDDSGRVVGLIARRAGENIAVRSTRGIVVTAGGFVHNDAMVHQHAPLLGQCSMRLGTDLDRGTGIQMAQALGADVRHMDAAEVAVPLTPPRSLMAGILVNGHGQRFINEDTYYGRIGQESLFRQGGRMFLIVDASTYRPTAAGNRASWVCDTIEELASEIGLPSGSLESTLALYNRHAESGHDPVFHKDSGFVHPLLAPLGAFDFTTANSVYATFTLGGLATLPTGEVLDASGEPIAGLYAAGRTTAGIAASGYASGISLGDATFFGRLAGRSAAEGSDIAGNDR